MELPQPCQFGPEGRKPTHDFLSLCSHSSAVHQDPRPPSQGGCLQTLDLLRVGKTSTKEEDNMEISSAVEKPPPPAPPPASGAEEHLLPGGIGTYSISHISYINNVHQRVVPIKPEGSTFTVGHHHHHQQQQQRQASSTTERNDENSNCSSYTGSGFTLWEESMANNKKGKTGKENLGERSNINVREAGANARQWRTSGERPTQSSADNHRNSFNSHSQASGQRSQSFMEMIKSAKNGNQEEELDDNEELVLKKENSTAHEGELRVKVDGKSTDQKANTPRSKHSATEQRRRSKINDRFQMLRELIPHSDQKRDKASFLLEVIEYIQFLQEKVHKYEGSYQGWNHEPVKLMPWRNNHGPAENLIDHSRGRNSGSGPALMFARKFDEKNFTACPNIPGNAQNKADSDMSSATPFKSVDHHPGITNKEMPFPMSRQPNFFNSVRNSGFVAQHMPKLPSDAENMASQPQPQLCNSRSCTSDGAVSSDKMKEQDLSIEGGTIKISSIYSQGLLNTLTQALKTSGVDLSQASISVQIELGKGASRRPNALTSNFRDKEAPPSNQGITRSRAASDEDSDQVLKKLKTGKS